MNKNKTISLEQIAYFRLTRAISGIDDGDIDEALNELSFRHRQIIKSRFGLKDGATYTLKEVGQAFKITKEKVRNMEAKGLEQLRIIINKKL